ncbi:unnamed protein product, partial [marine sediment metagenome]
MDYQFTPEQEELRSTVRAILAQRSQPRDSFDGGPALDAGAWSALSELGLCGLGVDESLGGSGGDLIDQLIVVEEIGRAAAAVPFASSTVVSLPLVDALASDSQRERFLPAVASGELILTTALTGEGTGNPDDTVT